MKKELIDIYYLVQNLKKIYLNKGFKKYSKNAFWMTFEKVIRLSINLFVGVWLARYLGPSDFGVLNFAIAVCTIFIPLVNFGLQGILVKELFNFSENKHNILGTTFIFKLLLSILVFSIILFSGFFEIYSNQIEKEVVILVAISLLFQPFLVIDSWYESQVNTKKASILKTVFFGLGSLLKVLFILNKESLVSFAILYSIEAFLVAFALIMTYQVNEDTSFFKWRFKTVILRNLVSKSWLLVLSSISAMIYLKIDQVMIGSMISEKELGFYSAAAKLSEAWYFIPLILSNALFPAILNAKNKGIKEYTRRLQQLCDFFFITSFFLALITTMLSDFVIVLLYGEEYSTAGVILKVHIWAAIFIFFRTVLSKWLITEDKYKFSLISQLSGAVSNVILNLILIPKYGGVGAAIATLISYSVTSFFILGIFKETRPMFIIFIKSVILPIRIITNYEKFFKKN